MTDYSVRNPEHSDTTTDDLSEIVGAFVLSGSGFPPENFTTLELPVVDPEGNLNLNAFETAHGDAHSVESIDVRKTTSDVKDCLEVLANNEFDYDLGE